ncbi:MAG: AAA family ATPase [Actinomycetota bacterium]
MGGALVGRLEEQQQLAQLCARCRAGESGVLVVYGEAGIGKSALLRDALRHLDGVRVLRLSGAESEMELAYAGVQQVCSPISAGIDQLPDPQRDALQVALGLRDGDAPDPLMVSLAVLTLLGDAGVECPSAVIVDDAQWVDRASLQALTFAARRLLADAVVMLFATRMPDAPTELTGLPALHLEGLSRGHARALLSELLPGQLDDSMRENILAESEGNPLALTEFSHSMRPAELAGGYGLVAATPVAQRIENEYSQRIRDLPPATRTLLLLAASEPTGNPVWLSAAAAQLGVDHDAVVPAEDSSLIMATSRIRFRHPLVRSAVYRGASLPERRRAHAALADVITDPAAAEHRAWHRAHAATGADEAVAVELVGSADRARRRGGAAAAAAFLAYAVDLTPLPTRRAERALEAASATLDAGDPEGATRLLAGVRDTGDLLEARVDLLRAKIAFAVQRGRDAPPLLLAAAEKLRRLDATLARATYLDALVAAMIVGRLAADDRSSAAAIAAAAQHAPPAVGPRTSLDLFLEGIVLRLTEGHAAGAPVMARAIELYLAEDAAGTADPRSHDITLRVLLDLFDQETYSWLNARQVELLRAAGELTILPAALTTYAGERVTAGDFAYAAELLEQSDAISAATGAPPHRSIQTYLAACRGQEELGRELARSTIEDATARGEGSEITVVLFALAILHNGLGQYDEALAACESALRYDDVGMYGHVLTEMVEAAVRSGRADLARDAAVQVIDRAEASGTTTSRGYAARARALTSVSPAAEDHYRTAITELDRSPLTVMAARTHLVFGEWLRRCNRRADARNELRVAYERFRLMGADGFAERSRRELRAAGESFSKEAVGGSTTSLTKQESYIARLAGEGYSNSEIASHLFISPRTVEWHLSRVFVKLGVTSRRELRRSRG